ncbi:MAG: FAD-dependent oxidoreductase [Phycisphaerales bacterium]|nr:FAD-dependent oxidoreductase [Hyphomonadaceae bacterium]
MKRRFPKSEVALYEKSGRSGGRMVSVALAGLRPLELGAAFVSSRHPRILRLARDLSCDLAPVAFKSDGVFARDRWLNAGAGATGQAMLAATLAALAPDYFAQPPKRACLDSLSQLKLGDRYLWRCTIDEVLRRHWPADAIYRARATHGCTSNFGAANALDTLLTAAWEGAPGQRFFRFVNGAEAFCRSVLEDGVRAGVDVRTHYELAAITRAPAGLRLVFKTPAGACALEADVVILALPRHGVADLAIAEDIAGSRFRRDLGAIVDVPAFKLFLAYNAPWWRARGFAKNAGEVSAVFTDLPLQQNYFENEGRVMLGVFADGDNARVWRRYVEGAPSSALAPKALLCAAQRALTRLYGDIPAPCAGVYASWRAGWHHWRAGVRSSEVRERLAQPNPDLPLFICGELLAEHAGWSESALDNAEDTIERASAWMASFKSQALASRSPLAPDGGASTRKVQS